MGLSISRLLLCLVSLLLATQALAWGQDGHRLACAVAEDQLTVEGKAFIAEVTALGKFLDGKTPTFAEACLWPDAVKYDGYRGSYESHFINVPVEAPSLDIARDCAALDCILAGIQRNLVYLAKPAYGDREKARKAAALRFLGHLIADLHQPLHVSHAEDWGGNRIRVTWFGEETNLHRLWDVGLLQQSGLRWPESRKFLASVSADSGPVDILGWTRDTLSLARKIAYTGPDGKKIVSGDSLGKEYLAHAKPVVIQQLVEGAAHLALVINALAAGEIEPAFMELEN